VAPRMPFSYLDFVFSLSGKRYFAVKYFLLIIFGLFNKKYAGFLKILLNYMFLGNIFS